MIIVLWTGVFRYNIFSHQCSGPNIKLTARGNPRISISYHGNVTPYRGPAPFHRLTANKRFEPVFSTVIMAVCSLFNRMLLLTNLIPVHLLYCGQTVMIGCNHTSFEWTRAVRHIYGIIRHMQGLYFMHIGMVSDDRGMGIRGEWIIVME